MDSPGPRERTASLLGGDSGRPALRRVPARPCRGPSATGVLGHDGGVLDADRLPLIQAQRGEQRLLGLKGIVELPRLGRDIMKALRAL